MIKKSKARNDPFKKHVYDQYLIGVKSEACL